MSSRADYQRKYRASPKGKAYQSKFAKSAKGRYAVHKATATKRNIEWLFDFESWWKMWKPYWDRRGKSINSMQMCRTGDVGPYSPTNCRIDTFHNNLAEQHIRMYGPDKRKNHE